MTQIVFDSNLAKRALEATLARDAKVRMNFYQELRYFLQRYISETLSTYGVEVLRKKKKGISIFEINADIENHEFSVVKVKTLNPKLNSILANFHEPNNLFYIQEEKGESQGLPWRFISNDWQFPCLASFKRFEKHSIGSFALSITHDKNFTITDLDDLKLAGHCLYQNLKPKELFFCIIGVYFEKDVLQPYFSKYLNNCNCNADDLDEIRIGRFPQLFICRKCGKIYTCQCFKDYFDLEQDIINNLSNHNEYKIYIKEVGVTIRDNICHLCTREQPKGNYWGYSGFLGKGFLVYQDLLLKKEYKLSTGLPDGIPSKIYDECENTLRQYFNYPLIGEGKLISETKLFNLVKEIFKDKEVIRHYRGYELRRLEIDIFIPELKLGIEYQGEQHYKPVKQFGGKRALNRQKVRDELKQELCQQAGYNLIEFRYDEELSIELVRTKLSKYFD